MFYYKVKSKIVKYDGGLIDHVPDCDVPYEIMRYYRDYDESFVIGTNEKIEGAEEISPDNDVVKSRINWHKYMKELTAAGKING